MVSPHAPMGRSEVDVAHPALFVKLTFFALSPTAKIMHTHTDARGPSRKVDFCMLIEPQGPAADAIRAIQHQDNLFSQSLNHTDYQPLRRRPTALSIETKAPGEGFNDAQSQLLVWLEAQCRVLGLLLPAHLRNGASQKLRSCDRE